jgi:ribosome-binding factor A
MSRRSHRLQSIVQEITSQMLIKMFDGEKRTISRQDFVITRVEASDDLRSCVIYWLPSSDGKEAKAKEDRIRKELEKIKGPLRWTITDKLSYLRNSPEVQFCFDFVQQENERTNNLLDKLEKSVL